MVLYNVVFSRDTHKDINAKFNKSKTGRTRNNLKEILGKVRISCGYRHKLFLSDYLIPKNLSGRNEPHYIMPHSKKAVKKIREIFGDKAIEALIVDEV